VIFIGKFLNIANVKKKLKDAPFKFNEAFNLKINNVTENVLDIPDW